VSVLLAFNKPYGVLTQFTDRAGRRTLAQFISQAGIYPAGRLDLDSEGLLLLTDDGRLAQRIADPSQHMSKTYLVQVEGLANSDALERLRQGVELSDGMCAPALVQTVPTPDWLWPREPPIRIRQHIPTCWLQLQIREGRNRQVRRMTAAVGLPTLRLIRSAIGQLALGALAPGESRAISSAELGLRAHSVRERSRSKGTLTQ